MDLSTSWEGELTYFQWVSKDLSTSWEGELTYFQWVSMDLSTSWEGELTYFQWVSKDLSTSTEGELTYFHWVSKDLSTSAESELTYVCWLCWRRFPLCLRDLPGFPPLPHHLLDPQLRPGGISSLPFDWRLKWKLSLEFKHWYNRLTSISLQIGWQTRLLGRGVRMKWKMKNGLHDEFDFSEEGLRGADLILSSATISDIA